MRLAPRPLSIGAALLLATLGLATTGTGCATGIQALYEAERETALARAPDAGAKWMPDVRVRLSQDALNGLIGAAADQGLLSWKESLSLSGPFGVTAKITPSADVTSLTVSGSDVCDGCLGINAKLDGKAKWSAAGQSGTLPFTAKVGGVALFEMGQDGDDWRLSTRIKDVDSVRVGSASVGTVDATGLLGDWVSDALEKADPVSLGAFGGTELPLRAARISTPRGLLELQLLTNAPTGGPVTAAAGLSEDFEVRVSSATLLSIARRAAFEMGPIAMDVAAIPTSLTVNGDEFELGLRLWKLTGSGWWRDYQVTGTLSVDNKKIRLNPTGAVEGDKSQGAGLADPLALLAEGQILSAVEDGLRQALPASSGFTIGEQSITASVTGVTGARAAVELTGGLTYSTTRSLER